MKLLDRLRFLMWETATEPVEFLLGLLMVAIGLDGVVFEPGAWVCVLMALGAVHLAALLWAPHRTRRYVALVTVGAWVAIGVWSLLDPLCVISSPLIPVAVVAAGAALWVYLNLSRGGAPWIRF